MDLHTLTASIASCVASRMLVYPLDTIAIQQQTNTTRPLFPSTRTLTHAVRNLYRGLPVSIVLTTPAVAVYLCTYRAVKERLVPVPAFGDANVTYVVAGTCAEVVSSCLWTPLEVLKSRLQISHTGQSRSRGCGVASASASTPASTPTSTPTSTSTLRHIRAIFADEGVRGFYRGYGLGLAVFIPYNALWWSLYENAKQVARDRYGVEDVSRQAAVSSFFATAIATGAAHPLDLVKTRYQVATSESITEIVAREAIAMPSDRSSTRNTMMDGRSARRGARATPTATATASSMSSVSASAKPGAGRSSDRLGVRYVWRNVVRESGYRGFYAGLGPRLMCSVPGSVISMAVFEYFKPDVQQPTGRLDTGVGAPEVVVMDEVSA